MHFIPKLVKQVVRVVLIDIVIVMVAVLAFLGLFALVGWTPKDILKDFTPLILGMFSILVTVSALRLNIKEGRERARLERNQGVRPVLVLDATNKENSALFGRGRLLSEKECFVSSASTKRKLFLSIENAGLGVALNTEIFIRGWNDVYYLVAYEISKISPNDITSVKIKVSIPVLIKSILTRYRDIYDNTHYCVHGVCDDYTGPEQIIISNHYLEKCDSEELEKIRIADGRLPLAREVYMHAEYTADPKK